MSVIAQLINDRFAAYHGDTIEVAKSLPSNSVDHSVYSPPFASLYTYSASARDLGNCSNMSEFGAHMRYLVAEQFRVLKPGRLVAIHCMQLPTSKARDGVIGLQDFRGELIRMFSEVGFIYHSEVTIWKDPVTQMQRTHHIGLLHMQVLKDSSMSRQGLADYLIVMRKPGENAVKIKHEDDRLARLHDGKPMVWQLYASPVWDDINASKTLQYMRAREDKDERHICPLQLQVIERSVLLWSNPNEIVWSPFMGIGSEGYVALQENRRFIGAELKSSYYRIAVQNLEAARRQLKLPFEENPEAAQCSF